MIILTGSLTISQKRRYKKYSPKYSFLEWNSDKEMVVKI
jgi:hypothetical protein